MDRAYKSPEQFNLELLYFVYLIHLWANNNITSNNDMV
ncbi:MAG: hypothetical protein ACI971_000721 [Colwellia sp.]|jgi:hypothetical protein